MTQEGRQILYRVNQRLHEEWGAAVARLEDQPSHYLLCTEPFEAIAWHDAIYIIDALYHGWPVMEIFQKEERNRHGKPGTAIPANRAVDLPGHHDRAHSRHHQD